ncbi:MAG: hypothetical protein AAFP99_01190 [Pseudomonadota bacterium]
MRSVAIGLAAAVLSLSGDVTVKDATAEAADADPSCSSISRGVSFCGDKATWTPLDRAPGAASAIFHHSDTNYGVFIVEDFGTKDGASTALIREAIIQNAAGGAGIAPSEVPILTSYAVAVDETSAETIVYTVNLNGVDIVYANTIIVSEDRSVQAMTHVFGQEFTEAHQSLHAEFIGATELE